MLETRSEADSDGNAINRHWNLRRVQNVGSQVPPAPRPLQVRRLALGEASVRRGWAEGQPGEARSPFPVIQSYSESTLSSGQLGATESGEPSPTLGKFHF